MALAILLASQLGFSSCKKNAAETKNEPQVTSSIENQDKVLKFLSFVLNIPVSKIQIDHATEEFYIPDTGFRIKIAEATERYNAANVYKEEYEKQ